MSKKLLLLTTVFLVLLSLSFVVLVEADSLMWIQTYGGTEYESAYSLVATSDGGYAIAGETSSFGAGAPDFWLVKTDEYGNEVWNKTYGGTGFDLAESMVATSDGGYTLAGRTSSLGVGELDFWLVKTDGFGAMEWNRTYGGPEHDWACCLVATSDGGYAIAGHTYSFGAGGFDFWLVKTDESGNMEWNQTYGGNEVNKEAYALVETSDGGYAIAGWIRMEDGESSDVYLVKTDSTGNMEWNRTYGGPEPDWATALIATSDGGFAIAGETDSFGAGSGDFWLVKTDAAGNVEWNQTYGGNKTDQAYALVETYDGGYAIAGSTTSFGADAFDLWLVKTDSFGNMEWNQIYWGPRYASASALVATTDGGYAIAGKTNDDFWLIKTNEYGIIPEYSTWLFPSLLMVASLVIVVYKKKIHKHP